MRTTLLKRIAALTMAVGLTAFSATGPAGAAGSAWRGGGGMGWHGGGWHGGYGGWRGGYWHGGHGGWYGWGPGLGFVGGALVGSAIASYPYYGYDYGYSYPPYPYYPSYGQAPSYPSNHCTPGASMYYGC
jgi:hypothetical protein